MDAEGEEFGALGAQLGERDAADPGQGSDGLGDVSLGDEERLDEVAGFDDRLAEHGADTGRGAEAAEADGLVERGRHRKRELGLNAGQGNGEASPGPAVTRSGGTVCHNEPRGTWPARARTREKPFESGIFPWHTPCQ